LSCGAPGDAASRSRMMRRLAISALMQSSFDRRSRFRRRSFLASAALLVLACGGEKSHDKADSHSVAGTSAAAAQTAPVTSAKAACPATGQWSECAIVQALDRAGLAPRRDSTAGAISLPPLNVAGRRLLVGSAELDVFVYPDARARERDEARLDRTKFIGANDEPTLRGEATLIRNVNLLAILRSRNDHQRERVSDALSAGPPQPSGSGALPKTTIRK